MNEKRIVSENPESDIWKSLLRFSYSANIEKYISDKHGATPSADLVNSIAGSVTQAEAYFNASKSAPLDISPLLTYYGAINLLAASCSLKENQILNVRGHGASLNIPSGWTKIGDVEIKPNNPTTGGMQIYTNTFAPGTNLNTGDAWTLSELLGSLPDLKTEFEHCYGSHPFVIPVEIIKTRAKTTERIHKDEIASFGSGVNWAEIKDFSANYLQPQSVNDYIVLNRKISFSDCGTASISGRKYLEVGHLKSGSLVNPGLVISSLMGLYALSYLSRYVPEIWTPFVRTDVSGERLLIEHFLRVAQRQMPNLVLNLITGFDAAYVSEVDGVTDLTSVYTEADIKEIVDSRVEEIIKARNAKL